VSDLLVYVTIGNSDDRLTQQKWSRFVSRTLASIEAHASKIHGNWVSESASPYQNACFSFDLAPAAVAPLRAALESLRDGFDQDSIAWATAELDMVEKR
jgi:hypothetical protein